MSKIPNKTTTKTLKQSAKGKNLKPQESVNDFYDSFLFQKTWRDYLKMTGKFLCKSLWRLIQRIFSWGWWVGFVFCGYMVITNYPHVGREFKRLGLIFWSFTAGIYFWQAVNIRLYNSQKELIDRFMNARTEDIDRMMRFGRERTEAHLKCYEKELLIKILKAKLQKKK